MCVDWQRVCGKHNEYNGKQRADSHRRYLHTLPDARGLGQFPVLVGSSGGQLGREEG